MKFTINSKALLSRLLAAGKAVSNRPTLSILSNFLLALEGKTLTITASDTDNVVVSQIDVEDASGVGQVCIDAKRIIELLKVMPDCAIHFDVNDRNFAVVIRYSNGKYNLTGLSGDEFPKDDSDNSEAKGAFSMPTSQILNAMDKVGFAVANDELRPQLNGIFWEVSEDAITFVATDTRVLAKYRSTQTASGLTMSFILPGKSLSLVRALIAKQADVKLTVYDGSVRFEGEDFMLRSSLYKGKFPDYNRVIPTNQNVGITIDRMDFINAVSRVSVCADPISSFLRLKISDDAIILVGQDMSLNVSGEERIACDYTGDTVEIGFSSSYLKGVLNAMNTQNIVMKLLDATRPGLFLPAGNDEYGELTLLCMPMSIQTVASA